MPWTAFFAVAALLVTQLVIAGLSLYAYNRIRGKEDLAGLDKQSWVAKVELALNKADTAVAAADKIEVQHFKTLRAMYEAQSLEFADLKAKFKQLEAELVACRNKLASEERMNRRAVAKAARAAAPADDGEDDDTEDGPLSGLPAHPTMEDLRKAGLAVPMAPTQAPAAPTRDPSFGKVAR